MLPAVVQSEPSHARTLTERWMDRYRAELLARLEWELDAGWRTVTELCPHPVHNPVEAPPALAVVPHLHAMTLRGHVRIRGEWVV